MLSVRNRNLYALACSLVFHLLLFGGAFFANDFAAMQAKGELYETLEYIEHAEVQVSDSHLNIINRTANLEERPFEIILCSPEELKLSLKKLEQIDAPRLKAEINDKPKIAPIVKAPVVKPRLLNRTAVPYPARAEGAEGVVTVCILVGIDGKPEYVSTAGSSGNPFLDGAALDHCIKWRFEPARNEKNQKVRCLVYIPIMVKQ